MSTLPFMVPWKDSTLMLACTTWKNCNSMKINLQLPLRYALLTIIIMYFVIIIILIQEIMHALSVNISLTALHGGVLLQTKN